MTPRAQLASFLAKYDPAVARRARAVLATLRKRLPGALELVYDNYNALAIGFGPSARASEAIFSVAVFPRWVSLFFLQGAKLHDPKRRLRGKGTRARHVVLESARTIDDPAVRALMELALKQAKRPLDPRQKQRIVIRSISARQRPRRPARRKPERVEFRDRGVTTGKRRGPSRAGG